jgi:hypothetical protein
VAGMVTSRTAQGRAAGRVLICSAAAAVGAFTVVGCLLAMRLEVVGLGRPTDSGIRLGYMFAMAVGVAAGIAGPAVLTARLIPSRRRLVAAAALGLSVLSGLTMVALLGLG